MSDKERLDRVIAFCESRIAMFRDIDNAVAIAAREALEAVLKIAQGAR